MPRLTALGDGTARCDAGNGNRDGRAPQQCPSRAANGSLGWTNGAKGVAWKNPKGISSFSPALPDAIGLRRVTERE
jgi:hypothetical protein